MHVGASLVADRQASKPTQPGQGAFDHPAIAAQALAALDAFARDAHLDVASGQRLPAARDVIGFVGVQLGRALAWPPPWAFDRLDRVKQGLEVDAVMAIRRPQQDRQRNALTVDDQVVFAARFALVGGIPTDLRAPLLAGTLALSRLARLQSMRSASPNRSSKAWCSASQTPASCQSRRRRQHVTPLPQPISCGSSSQGIPDLSTKMMPVRAARSGTRGRPPFGFGGSGGSSGAMISQSSAETSGLAIIANRSTPQLRF